PMSVVIPGGNRLVVGEKTDFRLQDSDGESLSQLVQEYDEASSLKPYLEATKGGELVSINDDGSIEALAPGDVTLQVKVPGLASQKGFLFIEALGRVGVMGDEGEIHWDILLMVLTFGVSLYANQLLAGQGSTNNENPQQAAISKFTPIIFSGMFLFFPLPAGVLMYMVIANIFQTLQSFILSKEPLPENLQKIVDAEAAVITAEDGRQTLPFEPSRSKKKKKAS
ncbi:MAG: membrane protein insertase YidC, partial [Cyanobacteria bacterium P01_E01_bin.43]